MPTHQALSGASDEELVQRMVSTHPERFGVWATRGEAGRRLAGDQRIARRRRR